MELKCLHPYISAAFELTPGQTTEGMGISEEKKEQMVADFPEWFEKIGAEEVVKEEETEVTAKTTPKKRK